MRNQGSAALCEFSFQSPCIHAAGGVLANNAAIHHKYEAPYGCDVSERITIERDDTLLSPARSN
ncbi:MAG: hypothetical protein AABO41_28190 [Acidobacteriota bacterium]